ncbi:hypothetical protein MMC17_007391 [Xylographa soralifera]|nr:hypothetical protein [Xylographa soralifera]
MYFPLILSALAALTTAAPRATVQRRDGDCSAQSVGAGPVASPDTVNAFYSLASLQSMSTGAGTPAGYTPVFTNLQASVSAAQYLGVYTLTSYDTYGCASQCNHAPGCVAFNVYAERDPTLNANATNCPNPSSTTNYQCTLWGATISASQATNTGQYRDSFQVAIAASNGYNSLSPSCTPAPAITNGGFETGALAPWTVIQNSAGGWTFGFVGSPGIASAYAFSASLAPNPNHASSFSNIILQQNLNTCPGRNYSIAFDVSLQYANPSDCSVYVTVPGGLVSTGSTFTAVGSDDLLQVDFSCYNGATNNIEVDNFVVVPFAGAA